MRRRVPLASGRHPSGTAGPSKRFSYDSKEEQMRTLGIAGSTGLLLAFMAAKRERGRSKFSLPNRSAGNERGKGGI